MRLCLRTVMNFDRQPGEPSRETRKFIRLVQPEAVAPVVVEPEPKTVEIPVGISLRKAVALLVNATLEEVGGNKHKAARILGISRNTLKSKIARDGR